MSTTFLSEIIFNFRVFLLTLIPIWDILIIGNDKTNGKKHLRDMPKKIETKNATIEF
jgi:hypothetical protein